MLRLHPRLAPIKVAVLPLSKNEKLVPVADEVAGAAAAALHDRRRHGGLDRPPLPAPGRDRHAAVRHRRLRHPRRPGGHRPRPRHDGAGPGADRRAARRTRRSRLRQHERRLRTTSVLGVEPGSVAATRSATRTSERVDGARSAHARRRASSDAQLAGQPARRPQRARRVERARPTRSSAALRRAHRRRGTTATVDDDDDARRRRRHDEPASAAQLTGWRKLHRAAAAEAAGGRRRRTASRRRGRSTEPPIPITPAMRLPAAPLAGDGARVDSRLLVSTCVVLLVDRRASSRRSVPDHRPDRLPERETDALDRHRRRASTGSTTRTSDRRRRDQPRRRRPSSERSAEARPQTPSRRTTLSTTATTTRRRDDRIDDNADASRTRPTSSATTSAAPVTARDLVVLVLALLYLVPVDRVAGRTLGKRWSQDPGRARRRPPVGWCAALAALRRPDRWSRSLHPDRSGRCSGLGLVLSGLPRPRTVRASTTARADDRRRRARIAAIDASERWSKR